MSNDDTVFAEEEMNRLYGILRINFVSTSREGHSKYGGSGRV